MPAAESDSAAAGSGEAADAWNEAADELDEATDEPDAPPAEWGQSHDAVQAPSGRLDAARAAFE
jgi:hypothetical protein